MKRYGFALLPTPQLFQALVDRRKGQFDSTAFWDALFGTVGPTALPEPATDE
jgi:hypothetical protein